MGFFLSEGDILKEIVYCVNLSAVYFYWFFELWGMMGVWASCLNWWRKIYENGIS